MPNPAMSPSDVQTMANGKVSYAVRDGVALLTLTNPPANGYSYEMMRDLDEAVLRAHKEHGGVDVRIPVPVPPPPVEVVSAPAGQLPQAERPGLRHDSDSPPRPDDA